MVPADSRRIPRAPRYSGCHWAPFNFAYWTITNYGRTFQTVLLMIRIPRRGPTTPTVRCHTGGLGSSPFARHYWGNHCLFSLPQGTKMFQFPWFASIPCAWIITLQVIGLSHSEIRGSRAICAYPKLIAAYHVLHRLREPRHPPDALTCFRITFNSSYFQL